MIQQLRVFILLSLLFPLLVSAKSPSKPNILFILTDDQGYGDLAKHGHPLLKTPHLDQLSGESVRFENFYVSASCSPTRAALMTGRHEFLSGVTHTIQPREHLSQSATILPQHLKKAGYRTGFIGKWHLGNGKGYSPANRGFDWTSTNQKGSRNHFDPLMIGNGKREKRKGFREDVFFDEAMTFIEEAQGQPFFCYLATYSPHAPLAAPEKFLANYQGKVSEKQAAYLGMIENIDYNVGRILKFLKERDLEKNTIVVFMNDNGVTEGLDVYNAGMRGCKCTIWEGGSRAMSFWRWPGQWQSHQVDNLTAHLDVLPTLCDYAGADLPKNLQQGLEGFSLRPLLESSAPVKWHDDRILYHHVARWPGGLASLHKYAMAGARQGNYLLLRSHSCGDPACTPYASQCTTLNLVGKGIRKITYTDDKAQFHWGVSAPNQWSLFDSKKDPACQHDLSAEKPELVKTLSAAYEKWWDTTYPQMIAAGGDKGEPLKRGGRAKK
ncbi:arylsulfatase [Verrucomicrobiaceae bacterium 227]